MIAKSQSCLISDTLAKLWFTYLSTLIISDLTFDQLPSQPITKSNAVPSSSSVQLFFAFPLLPCPVFSRSPPVPWVCDSSWPGTDFDFGSDNAYALRDLKSMRDSLMLNLVAISDGSDSTRR
jgi:hypothetical protein